MVKPIQLLAAHVLVGIITLATASGAQAQEVATMDVTAQVISPLTASSTRALDFGRLFVASTRTVAPASATSGRVELSGTAGLAVSITVTVPTVLRALTGENLPVVNWNYVLGTSPTLTNITPVALAAGTPVSLNSALGGLTGTGKLYLSFGATVQVPATAPLGAYTATAQITAAYADL